MPSSYAASCQWPGEPGWPVPEVADAVGLRDACPPLQHHCHHDFQQFVLLVRRHSQVFSLSGPGPQCGPTWPVALWRGSSRVGNHVVLCTFSPSALLFSRNINMLDYGTGSQIRLKQVWYMQCKIFPKSVNCHVSKIHPTLKCVR